MVMKKAFVLCVLAAAATWGTSAMAVGRLADVTVTDRSSGATLPVHYYRGEYWVAGLPGAKYAIDIRNASGARVLAVTSVDGVNVVSGETASTAQTGYVFGAWQRYGITGWRKSNNDVAAFEFTASPNSYAERTGRPRDVGVIGVALFREHAPVVPPIVPYPYHSHQEGRSESDTAPAAAHAPTAQANRGEANAGLRGMADKATAEPAAPRERDASETSTAKRAAPQAMQSAPKLGTGHGERETSVVNHTAFERERSAPNEVIRIRYDSRENLIAMGVIPQYRAPQPSPNAFPDSPVGYAPDPPHYR
jgi:pyruvate/2-oxoglutarate dehydrogenase complex dihydrolipoamide acyltransferase (E2) component